MNNLPEQIKTEIPVFTSISALYSSGHTKCAFPASSPSIKMFCPVPKRFVTVIKYAHLQNQLSVLPLSLDEFHIFLNLVAAHRVPATDISSAAYS